MNFMYFISGIFLNRFILGFALCFVLYIELRSIPVAPCCIQYKNIQRA